MKNIGNLLVQLFAISLLTFRYFSHRFRNGRGHGGHGPLTFRKKIVLKIFPFFRKHNLYIENDSPEREEHKICVEMYRRGVSFCSRRDRSFTGPLTFGDVPTPLFFSTIVEQSIFPYTTFSEPEPPRFLRLRLRLRLRPKCVGSGGSGSGSVSASLLSCQEALLIWCR